MSDRLDRLLALRARIVRDLMIDEWKIVWFWPEWEGVRGYCGTDDIMFVGLNPSLGGTGFPSPADRRLYGEMKSNGLANAHLTDLIKESSRGQDVRELVSDPAVVDRNQEYLRQELFVLRPRVVVAFGKKVHKILRDWIPGIVSTSFKRPDVLSIPHFSPMIRTPANFQKFRDGVRDVARTYAQGIRSS